MDVLQYNIIQAVLWHGGSGACTAASQQDSHGFHSRMGRCWLWGAGPPQTFNAQVGYRPGLSVWSLHVLPRPSVLRWAISRAFLCGVCMFSPCSQGVSSTKNSNRKNMQNNRSLSCLSLTKTDMIT